MLAYMCCEQKDENVNQEILDNIAAAKAAKAKGTEFKYEDKDVILYNLGIGAKKTELSLVLYVPIPVPSCTFYSANTGVTTVREPKIFRLCHHLASSPSSPLKAPTASMML
jgi:hypothetical protein